MLGLNIYVCNHLELFFLGSMMFYFRLLVFKFGMSHFPAGWIWSWCFWTVSPPTGNVGVSGSKTLALTVLTVGTAPSGGARYETAIRRRQLRIFGMIPSKYLHNLTHMYIYICTIYIIVYIYKYYIIHMYICYPIFVGWIPLYKSPFNDH